MEYCVMGLGDTSYEQFNEMAIFCDNGMTKLGATRYYELGAANQETYTTEDDFMKWKSDLWTVLFKHFSAQQTEEQVAQADAAKKTKSTAVIDPNQMPFKVVIDGELAKESTFEYALNMRNYSKSADVTVKSVIELR